MLESEPAGHSRPFLLVVRLRAHCLINTVLCLCGALPASSYCRVTDDIIAMARPSNHLIEKYNMIDQFQRLSSSIITPAMLV